VPAKRRLLLLDAGACSVDHLSYLS
jgi:hypothetical protein